MTAPMTPERLAEIRRLLGWADIAYERTAGHPPPDHIDHELLAEVDRLIEALEGAVKLAETLNTEVSRLTERCAALEAERDAVLISDEDLLGAIGRAWSHYPVNHDKVVDSDLAVAVEQEVRKLLQGVVP